MQTRTEITTLKEYYNNLNWLERWFFPSDLAEALEKKDSKPSTIYHIFDNLSFFSYIFSGISTFFYSKPYASYVSNKTHYHEYWIEFLDFFNTEEAQEKLEKINELPHEAHTIGIILSIMNRSKPLTRQRGALYFDNLINHPNLDMLFDVLLKLSYTSLMTGNQQEKNFLALVNRNDMRSRRGGLKPCLKALLSNTKLLEGKNAQNNFDLIMKLELTHGGDFHHALIEVPNSIKLFQGPYAQEVFELIAKHKRPYDVAFVLSAINDMGIDINPFFKLLETKQRIHEEEIIFILTEIHKEKLLETDHVLTVLRMENPSEILNVLPLLIKNNLLNHPLGSQNLRLVAENHYLRLDKVLKALDDQGALTQENFHLHFFGGDNSNLLQMLKNANILNNSSIEPLFKALRRCLSLDMCYITEISVLMTKAELLARLDPNVFINLIEKEKFKLSDLSSILGMLYKAEMLSLEGLNTFNHLIQKNETNLRRLNIIFERLEKQGLLTQENFNQFLDHEDLEKLMCVIVNVADSGVLTTQAILDMVIGKRASLLNLLQTISQYHLRNYWPQIEFILSRDLEPDMFRTRHGSLQFLFEALNPDQLRTHWQQLEEILRRDQLDLTEENRLTALRDYVNYTILGRQRPLPQNQPQNRAQNRLNTNGTINKSQSTHTASVHATTDLTAWLLLAKNKEAADSNTFDLKEIVESIKSQLAKEKKALNQEIEKLKLNTTLKENEKIEKLKSANQKLNDLLVLESRSKSAYQCLTRLNETSVNLVLEVDQKNKLWTYIQESELKQDKAIKELLPVLEETKSVRSTLSLNEFIYWIYEEIESTSSSNSNHIIAMIDALFDVENGYNLDSSGNHDGQKPMSICYGGTANKFCERLQGFSSLILFIFTTPQTISVGLKQNINNAMLEQCQNLLDKAKKGSSEEKSKFCNLINALMDPNEVGEVFTTLFEKANIAEKIHEEFKFFKIIHGAAALEEIIKEFKEWILPFPTAFNPKDEEETYYSENFSKAFKEIFISAKTEFEIEAKKQSEKDSSTATTIEYSPANTLANIVANIGLMPNPLPSHENTLNDQPSVKTSRQATGTHT